MRLLWTLALAFSLSGVGAASAADWRAELDARTELAWSQHPNEAKAAAEAEPILTRNGMPRFVGEEVWNPHATPVLLSRALDPAEPQALRVALIEAAVKSGGEWSAVVAGQLAVEQDVAVRRMLAEVLREAEPADAARGLRLAVRDPSAEVRAAAQRAIGGRPDGATLSALVLDALDDPSALVRAEAARSAGWLHLDAGWDGLAGLLADEDAEVRLRALRALERLDAPRLAALPALSTLRQDLDPRVARAAGQIR